MKTIALLLLFAVSVQPVCAIDTLAADPVQDLSARQRYPWNGLVDISFTLADGAGRSIGVVAWPALGERSALGRDECRCRKTMGLRLLLLVG